MVDPAPASDTSAPSAEGPAPLPPEPARRSISPAPQDYANPPALGKLLWPLIWCALTVAIGATLWGTWPAFTGH